jgi:hypothetical protein
VVESIGTPLPFGPLGLGEEALRSAGLIGRAEALERPR